MRRAKPQPPATQTYSVKAGTSTFEVAVTRKRVKNLNLRVRGDGSIVASVPARTSDARIQAFFDSHAAWIARNVARKQALEGIESNASEHVPEAFPLWGELRPAHKLLPARQRAHARNANSGILGEGAAHGNAIGIESRAAYERLLAARYREEVARALPAVAERLEAQMGVHAERWQIRSMKTRWGSCTPRTRAIRINSKLAAYPPACLEFVVAHELCHLIEPSHNARFHALLDCYCPSNRTLARLLKQPAAKLANAQPPR